MEYFIYYVLNISTSCYVNFAYTHTYFILPVIKSSITTAFKRTNDTKEWNPASILIKQNIKRKTILSWWGKYELFLN